MASKKPAQKSDPLLATPDGSRAKSAWLTKIQAATPAIEETGKTTTAYNGLFSLRRSNTLDANADYMLRNHGYPVVPSGQTAAGWELLLQWHGDAALACMGNQLAEKDVLKLACTFHTTAAQDLLLANLATAPVREAVAERAQLWPIDTLRRLLAQNPSRDQPAAHVLQGLLHDHPDWLAPLQAALTADGDDAQAKTLARLLTPAEKVTDATADELPAMLRQPPWQRGATSAALPSLELIPIREPARIDWGLWRGGSVEPRPQRMGGENRYIVEHRMDDRPWYPSDPNREDRNAARAQADTERWGLPGRALYLLGIRRDRVVPLLAGESVKPEDFRSSFEVIDIKLDFLGHLDDALALSLLRAAPPDHWKHEQLYGWESGPDEARNPAARLLKRFGPEHADLLLTVKPPDGSEASRQLLDIVDWDGLALWLSERGLRLRTYRANAMHWLLGHPDTAARALIPEALSADAARHAHARFHLHLLVRHGHADTIRTQAARYGQPAQDAVEQLLATPPENLLPEQIPKLPSWLNLPRLPRLLLAGSGHAIPLAHMPDALMPLALAKGGMAYAGLDKLQEAVTPDSLARLMLGLFEQWAENDMPAKDRWIFELQGRLGDDATARALVPRIRTWRSHLDRVRSYEGLEMLTQIGSDTALMLLASFTEQKRYTDLADRAAKALTRVAEERGLTRDELADRTVPTLGLDERGRMALDFGPRQFSASLSADLTPQVFDTDGARLKDLPKPGAKDDATLAKAASADWKELKKQAKLVAQTQIARLESAMCAQRRWSLHDFMLFFVQHPVLRGLTQRLVWAVFDAQDQWQAGFRVAEDATLADVHDAAFTPPPDARIGLPHPLEMPNDARRAWGQVLADYELLQVFEQLARATYGLQPDEATKIDLPRYAGRKVGTGSLLGLEARGWKRGAGDGGMLDHFTKPLGDGLSATLSLVEGWFIAGAPPAASESHELTGVRLERTGNAAADRPTWADLPAIAVSELLRDLERMAWHTQ